MARKPADQSVNRSDIILAAAEVLRRNGYDAATMKDIAAAVNLTAASLYHHFRNKDALLLAVLEAGLEVVIADTEPVVRSDLLPDAKLRAMIHIHVESLTNNTAVAAAMVFEIRTLMQAKAPGEGSRDSDREAFAEFVARREAFFARRDYYERLLRRVIRDGVNRGMFVPVDDAIFTKTLLGAQNWVGVWFRPEGRLSGAAIAEHMAETFLRALRL